MSMKPSGCICTIFGAQGTQIFSSCLPGPLPLPYLANKDSGFGFALLIFFQTESHVPLTPTLPLPLSPSFSPTATHSIPFTSSHCISLFSVDVIVGALQIACVYLCIHGCFLCVWVVTYVLCQPVCGLLPQTQAQICQSL